MLRTVGWLIRVALFAVGLAAIFWVPPRFGVWAPLAHAVWLLASVSVFLYLGRERE
jgi:hypothetical protein